MRPFLRPAQTEMDSLPHPAIKSFRDCINKVKVQILDSTDTQEAGQSVRYLDVILNRLSELAYILRKAINSESLTGDHLAVAQIFQKEGGLDYLHDHPELKDEFLHYVDQDLIQYPYAKNTTLITRQAKKEPVTAPPAIVPNE
jgi:hypothetical protein